MDSADVVMKDLKELSGLLGTGRLGLVQGLSHLGLGL